ncbi:unnamed protein product [Mytilus coruscus]|uniref:Integrase catalytic domain-containing protein n=1 Tax=Mytilus coruscus TaxID=42192 RepID=A0A6J8EPG4_MYTCO|nr:unnamed protein product [Mytilus coruscus]
MGEVYGYRKAELQVASASKHPKSNDKHTSDFAALQSQIDIPTLSSKLYEAFGKPNDPGGHQARPTGRTAILGARRRSRSLSRSVSNNIQSDTFPTSDDEYDISKSTTENIILQQFNFELRYKPAKDLQVAEALPRLSGSPNQDNIESPDQEDPSFPYVPEQVGDIQFEGKRVEFPYCMVSENTDLTFNSHDQHKPDKCDSDDHSTVLKSGDRNSTNTTKHDIHSESDVANQSAESQETDITTDNNKIYSHSANKSSTFSSDSGGTLSNSSFETASSQDKLKENFTESFDIFRNGEYSTGTFHKLQVKDPYFGPFIPYIEQNKLPSSQKPARKFLLEIPNYDMVEGLLFHTRTAKCKRTKLFGSYQLALSKVAMKTDIRLYHDSPLDAFTKFIVAKPIPNKDSLTGAEVLFKLVSKYGVCDTIISDRGSEAKERAIKEVCRLLEITHQFQIFTQSSKLPYRLCERTQYLRTFAEKIRCYSKKENVGKIWFRLSYFH